MTRKDIQRAFPHQCPGYDCKVCWWVDGREQERDDKRRQVLSRLDSLLKR